MYSNRVRGPATASGPPRLGTPVGEAPAYSAPAQSTGIEVGASGYVVEKKPDGQPAGAAGRPAPVAASSSRAERAAAAAPAPAAAPAQERPPVVPQHSYAEHTDDSSEEEEQEEEDEGDTTEAEAETADEHHGDVSEETPTSPSSPTAVGHFVEQLGGAGGHSAPAAAA